MGRRSLTCKHGVTPKSKCPKCRKEWNDASNQKYREARLRGEVEPRNVDCKFPYGIDVKIQRKFKQFYWSKSIITKAVLNDRTCTPTAYLRTFGEYFGLQNLPEFK